MVASLILLVVNTGNLEVQSLSFATAAGTVMSCCRSQTN